MKSFRFTAEDFIEKHSYMGLGESEAAAEIANQKLNKYLKTLDVVYRFGPTWSQLPTSLKYDCTNSAKLWGVEKLK